MTPGITESQREPLQQRGPFWTPITPPVGSFFHADPHVARADDYLRANLARPIYTTEISAALGASPRTLHDAFHAVHGMSLHGYLHRRRMALVRDALKRASGSPVLVKTIALTHGFWTFGRFSLAYRHMFGESPSATLGVQRRGSPPARPG